MRSSTLNDRPDDDRAPRREKRLMAANESRPADNAVNVPTAPPVEAAERDWTFYREVNADMTSKGH